MLKRRIIGAALVVLLVLPAAWIGGLPFAVVVFGMATLGLMELRAMLSRKELHMSPAAAMAATVALTLSAYRGSLNGIVMSLAISVLLSLALPVVSAGFGHSSSVTTMYAIVYVPFLFVHLILLRERGVWLLALAILCTWACDVMAYFFGVAFGRHKMAPTISPKKSWEGGLGGLLGSCAVALLISSRTGLGIWGSLAAGAALGVAGQVGDLAESVLKRYAGVKDSGAIIPGHGGILDRFDSLLFNGTVLFYIVTLFL